MRTDGLDHMDDPREGIGAALVAILGLAALGIIVVVVVLYLMLGGRL